MKRSFCTLVLVLPLFFLVGCGSSEPTNMVNDASQEELDNYEKLIAEANSEIEEGVDEE